MFPTNFYNTLHYNLYISNIYHMEEEKNIVNFILIPKP